MSTLALIFKEIWHRKVNFLLATLAVLMAVALFVAFFTTAKASVRETKKIMLGMGHNLRIIPKETNMDTFWMRGFSEHTMPQEYINRFTAYKGFSYTHLIATLQQAIKWRGKTVILTGIAPEVFPPDKSHQKPMTFSVEPGTAYVGFEPAESLDIKKGDAINILGRDFSVIKCLSQSGSNDDIRIYGDLNDVQQVLNMPGRINEIQALECLCIIEASKTPIDPLEMAKQQLAKLLPQGKVILLKGIAEIRQMQRAMISGHMALIMPIVVVVCGAWIAVLTMINVRDRRCEVGIMRALGYGSGKVAGLFLGKSIIIGLIGAFMGFLLGTALSLNFGSEIFKITAKAIKPDYALLVWSVIAAPTFAAISSFIPVTIVVSRDPADTLRED